MLQAGSAYLYCKTFLKISIGIIQKIPIKERLKNWKIPCALDNPVSGKTHCTCHTKLLFLLILDCITKKLIADSNTDYQVVTIMVAYGNLI